MSYDDKYIDDEEDNDLWDDELELTSDDSRTGRSEASRYPDTSDSGYSPYDTPYAPRYDDNPDSDENSGRDEDDENADNDENDYYSEPEEPTRPAKSRRKRFFSKDVEDEEEEDNDYYDSDSEHAPRKTTPKPSRPRLNPEDPDYWIEEDESPLSGIIPTPGKKWPWKLAVVLAAIAALIFVWIWFLRPHTDDAVKYGYIVNMERRGSLIKTFEGSMIPYKQVGDPDPLYFREQHFSVQSDSLAAVMKRMMLGCVPVRVEYEMYHSPLPWKGEQRMVIIKADTADPRKILPPEYRGKY